jgi:hypothetical protein
MAEVLNRTQGLTVPYVKQHIPSVNTGEFSSVDWIINPDLSAVAGFDNIYWDIAGDTVLLVDAATRTARDAEIAAFELQAAMDEEKLRIADVSTERVLRAIVKLLVDELNILRQQVNATTAESNQLTNTTFSDRTLVQARTAIESEIDGGI